MGPSEHAHETQATKPVTSPVKKKRDAVAKAAEENHEPEDRTQILPKKIFNQVSAISLIVHLLISEKKCGKTIITSFA
jgi:hypothetical protein